MACSCSANTLRLFVRTVTQINVPVYSTQIHPLRQVSRTYARTLSVPTALQFQRRHNSSTAAAPIVAREQNETDGASTLDRQLDCEITASEGDTRLSNSTAIEDDNVEPLSGAQISAEAESSTVTNQPPEASIDLESAFAELTPEAIEALATEVASSPRSKILDTELHPEPLPLFHQGLKQPAKEDSLFSGPLRSMNQRRKQRISEDSTSPERSTIKSKSKEAGFTISYSSPPNKTEPPTDDWVPPQKEPWQVQKARLKERFPDGWNPQKRLSPDAIAGIRTLHAEMPEQYTTDVLAQHFKISPDAIRRILKSKWRPDAETQIDREMRWFRRGERVWSRYAELGVKPPRRWRDEGIGRGKPEWKKGPATSDESSRIIPALVTTSRREGGYFGENRSSSVGTSYRGEDEKPELVTRRRDS
ncbi:hypothetical protein GLAREA_03618 [Glarea lozoyensis ATCC 20868]|uniref:Required for respiratory growth protein 9, mitochondrial n=1 Tax=Glarea lozoyensis (strain ATCC 20868 / MF5171) TaxID=1116229 RepID=S3DF93_GLAL2|nr:uncharacterized protein GLAREA_03618 [Glarea lozoyensis ATCC 20868]EPE30651.1 hypothetical protein GLAREA_03618 [Glarea lozoyensis ATCC 20868]